MKNPLIRRFPRELKSEAGKYIVIFLFLAGMISFISGFLVAGDSMTDAYNEGFEKYNIEDGAFELADEAGDPLIDTLEKENLKIYPKFYTEEQTAEVDSTLRIYKNRENVDLVCVLEGKLPDSTSQIAIDRMYADNNKLKVGDTLTAGGEEFEISGLIAASDYSALFSSQSDMMFDAIRFGVAVVTPDGFDRFGTDHIHYSYAYKYDSPPADKVKAADMADDFLEVLYKNAQIKDFNPQYSNQAIHFTGDDISSDKAALSIFLYIVIIIIAFIFAITTSNTVTKESCVIGTLRASGYSKGELIRHYLAMPAAVMLFAAIVGNILGYTVFKYTAADMYYSSYSLPTYVTKWNAGAFVKTTVIPLILIFVINFVMLVSKMNISPLKFLRRDLKKKKNKKAFRLNTKISIMNRFRLRIIFQNIPNYVTIIFGIFLANLILLFGFMFDPLIDNYQDSITSNMICEYQYVLKMPQKTENETAEKYCITSLETKFDNRKNEEVSVYGITDSSRYVDIDTGSDGVYISDAYAEKFRIKTGDTISLKETYGTKEYSFRVAGTYYYPAAIAVFMSRDDFNAAFDMDEDYFNGYFSNSTVDDIDDTAVASLITLDDLTKTSRQLRVSIGTLTSIFLYFGVIMFMMIIYLLSKIIIEKNSQSISVTKILGYSNVEIDRLYILSTSLVVIISVIGTIPLVNLIMKYVCAAVFSMFTGWLPYYVPVSALIKMGVIGIAAYAVIVFAQMRKIKKIPLTDALKNVE